jgi:hypothetical protein
MKPYQAILAALILAFFVACPDNGRAYSLYHHGQETGATVVGMHETKAGFFQSESWSIRVAFWALDAGQIVEYLQLDPQQPSVLDEEKSKAYGQMNVAEIGVSQDLFRKLKSGQKLQIIYLPENPRVVDLKVWQ